MRCNLSDRSVGEMPEHTHGAGTLRVTGQLAGIHGSSSGVFTDGSTWSNKATFSGTIGCGPIKLDTLNKWSGKTESTGSSTAHNNIQPSKAAYGWIRTV